MLRTGPPGSDGLAIVLTNRRDGTLAPGPHRLYVMGDAPATAHLRFTEGHGVARVASATPFGFEGGPLATMALPDRGAAFGRWGSLTTRGFMWMVASWGAPADEPVERMEFWPTATTRWSRSGPTRSHRRRRRQPGIMGLHFGAPAGRYGVGGNVSRLGDAIGPVQGGAGFASYVEGQPPGDPPRTAESRPAPPAPPAGTLGLARSRIRVHGRRALVPVRCSGAGPRDGAVAIGRRSRAIRLPAGRTETVAVRLAPRLARRVRRSGRARALLVLSSAGPSPAQIRQRVTLVRR